MKRACLALDVGGTKIAAALIDADGAILAGARRPTGAAMGAGHVLTVMAGCLDELAGPAGQYALAGIGISAAGVIDPLHARVLDATDAIPGWKDQALGAWFNARYQLPVWADNDVNCALLGELWRNPVLHGSGSGASVAMLTLGTGLGGALAHDGRILPGRHFSAGHFGRALVWDGFSGALQPVESLVSGTALARMYRRTGQPGGQGADGADVMARAAAGEPRAVAALDTWLDHLALQLHNLYWSFDPDLVLIGGGVIDSRDLWWDALQQRIDAYKVNLRLAPAALGGDAGLVGAARLVWNAGAKKVNIAGSIA